MESFASFPKLRDYESGEEWRKAALKWRDQMVTQIKDKREEVKARFHYSPLLDSIFKEILGEA